MDHFAALSNQISRRAHAAVYAVIAGAGRQSHHQCHAAISARFAR
jgi:hypothetical protein